MPHRSDLGDRCPWRCEVCAVARSF